MTKFIFCWSANHFSNLRVQSNKTFSTLIFVHFLYLLVVWFLIRLSAAGFGRNLSKWDWIRKVVVVVIVKTNKSNNFRFPASVKSNINYSAFVLCLLFVGVWGHHRPFSQPLWWFYHHCGRIRRRPSSRPFEVSSRPTRQRWTKGRINPAQPLCVKYPSKAASPDAALSLWTLKCFTVLQTNTFIFPALFCLWGYGSSRDA